MLSGEASKKGFCASNRQTDSKNGLFSELTTEHPRDRVQKWSQDGLVNLALKFGHDEAWLTRETLRSKRVPHPPVLSMLTGGLAPRAPVSALLQGRLLTMPSRSQQ
jgi:hypothetical protein